MLHLVPFALVATVMGLCCGCGAPPDEGASSGDARKVVGATLLTQTHVFYQDMVEAMQTAAEARGITLRVQYAEFDGRRQNDHIDTFLAQGVDALLVAPTDSSGITPAIAQARADGVPVFTIDIAAPDAEVVSHIASDNERGGYLLGEYMAQLLEGEGTVAIVDHPVVTSVQDRTRGFEAAVAKVPGIRIVQRIAGEGQRDKAFRVTQDLLQAHPDLDGIFGINDDSALGALAAVEAAGMADDIVIVGFDGTPEAREVIATGSALKADAVQFPREVGRVAIETIASYFDGANVPANVPVAVEIIDRESLRAEPSS